jgi:serine/threonine protein kinase
LRNYAGVDLAARSLEGLVNFYGLIKDIPSTSTIVAFEEKLKLHINGPISDHYPNILSAIDENEDWYVLKLLRITYDDGISCSVQQREHAQEIQRCTELGLASPVVALCPVEAIEVDYEGQRYVVLKMPRCMQTLYDKPRTFPNAILKQGTQLMEALTYIHNHNIVHMDIKADNIFIRQDKSWLLGDFGSSKHINEEVTSTNLGPFVRFKILTAQPKYDWLMLLMVLLKETLPNKHHWIKAFCDVDNKYNWEKIVKYIEELGNTMLKDLFVKLQGLATGFDSVERRY